MQGGGWRSGRTAWPMRFFPRCSSGFWGSCLATRPAAWHRHRVERVDLPGAQVCNRLGSRCMAEALLGGDRVRCGAGGPQVMLREPLSAGVPPRRHTGGPDRLGYARAMLLNASAQSARETPWRKATRASRPSFRRPPHFEHHSASAKSESGLVNSYSIPST